MAEEVSSYFNTVSELRKRSTESRKLRFNLCCFKLLKPSLKQMTSFRPSDVVIPKISFKGGFMKLITLLKFLLLSGRGTL